MKNCPPRTGLLQKVTQALYQWCLGPYLPTKAPARPMAVSTMAKAPVSLALLLGEGTAAEQLAEVDAHCLRLQQALHQPKLSPEAENQIIATLAQLELERLNLLEQLAQGNLERFGYWANQTSKPEKANPPAAEPVLS